MPTLSYICETCDSEFTIDFDDTIMDEAPTFCPFCGDTDIYEDEFRSNDP